jgi:hypothetical protein
MTVFKESESIAGRPTYRRNYLKHGYIAVTGPQGCETLTLPHFL